MTKEKVTWTTKDGKVLVVDEITDINHLRNIIKYLLKKQDDAEDYECGNYGDLQDTF